MHWRHKRDVTISFSGVYPCAVQSGTRLEDLDETAAYFLHIYETATDLAERLPKDGLLVVLDVGSGVNEERP